MSNQTNQLNRIEELLDELLEIQRASTSEAVLERIDRNREVCEDTIPLTSDVFEGIGRKEKKRTILIEDGVMKGVEVDADKFKEIEDRANNMLQDILGNNDGRKGGWVYYDERRKEFLFKTASEPKDERRGCDEWKRIASIAEDHAIMSKYASPMSPSSIKLWRGGTQ